MKKRFIRSLAAMMAALLLLGPAFGAIGFARDLFAPAPVREATMEGFGDDMVFPSEEEERALERHNEILRSIRGEYPAADLPDTDGDGIPDDWEMYGVDYDGDGIVDLDLPAMGADPNKPDVFVEIDWMEGMHDTNGSTNQTRVNGVSKYLSQQEFLDITAKEFFDHSINLHIDFGPDSIDYVTKQRWRDYPDSGSTGNALDYYTGEAWPSMQTYYNTISPSRRPVFHYFALVKNTEAGAGGMAVVTGMYGMINYASAFMHELGHNLGLGHGGRPDGTRDDTNNKVNYLSCMNYAVSYTFYTYSDWRLPDLDENHLNETAMLDPENLLDGYVPPAGETFNYYYRTSASSSAVKVSGTGFRGNIDYNGNGTYETDIVMNIHREDSPRILKGCRDWAELIVKNSTTGNTYGTINTITYNAAVSGASNIPGAQTKLWSKPIALSSLVPTHPSYTFQGWSTMNGGPVEYLPGEAYSGKTSITLYAVWELKPGVFAVTLDKNLATASYSGPLQAAAIGGVADLPSTAPTCSSSDRKNFLGWAVSPTATTPDYLPSAQLALTAHLTLYGVWAAPPEAPPNIPVNVSFNYPGQLAWIHLGTGFSGNYTARLTSTIAANMRLTWYYDDTGGYGYTSGTANPKSYSMPGMIPTVDYWVLLTSFEVTRSWDSTFVALTNPATQYIVSYFANGGTGAPAPQMKISGTPLALTGIKPTRAGYAFKGWAITANAVAPDANYAPGSTYSTDNHLTLYAVWEEITPPTITSASNTTMVSGTASTFQVTATGTAPISYSLTGAPTGVTINSTSGLISIGAAVAVGVHSFTVTASNGALTNAAQAFTLTVNAAPGISGPTALTLTAGYGATSTDAFTATGSPAPTVTKTSGNAAITWNSGTKKLDIAAGLTAGIYPVEIKASNGVGTDATITFTLTVNAAPGITGPTALTLTAGYAAASTDAFTVTGNPVPTVTKTSGTAAITWNSGTKKLDIAAGLAAGEYPVELKASNGVGTDATITFTLTVNAVSIAVTSAGLGSLKVDVPVTGASVTYTLSNAAYAASITPADFAVSNLSAGLSAGAAVRTSSTVVTVPITGTPTTYSAGGISLTIPSSVAQANVTGAPGAVPVTGSVTTGPIAKGDVPFPVHAAKTVTYTPALTLNDVVLDTGYAWVTPTTTLTAIGTASYPATYTKNTNYNSVSGTIAVTVNKADAAFGSPAAIDTTYTPTLKLSDITLPAGYAWVTPATSLSAGTGFYAATYQPDAANYNAASGSITVNVAKAAGSFGSPAAVNTTYTPTLKLSDVTPPTGYAWVTPGTTLTAGDGQTFAATYTQNANYFPANGSITVNVAKANAVFGSPAAISVTYTSTLKLGDITPPAGYTWSESATSLSAGTDSYAATYQPDAANYNAVSGRITVIVAKADAAFGTPTAVSATYAPGLTLADLTSQLAPGYTWTAPATALNAGSGQTFAATYQPNGNYNAASGMIMVNVTKAFALAASAVTREVVIGSPQTINYNLADLLPSVNPGSYGTLTYAVAFVANDYGVLASAPILSPGASSLSLSVASVTDINRTAAITFTVTSTNYADFNVDLIVKTIDKTPVTITGVTMNGKTYDGQPCAYTGAPVVKNGATPVSGIILETLYTSTDGGGYSGAAAPTNAGSYQLTLSVPAGNASYSGKLEQSFTILKKELTVRADDKSVKQGSAQPAYTYTFSPPLVPGDTLLTPPAVACSTADMNVPGAYPIVPSGADAGPNYNVGYQNGTLTVTALSAMSAITGVVSPVGSTISGTVITASVPNGTGSLAVNVAVSQGAAWKLYADEGCTQERSDKNMPLAVGANTAWIQVTAENGTSTVYRLNVTRADQATPPTPPTPTPDVQYIHLWGKQTKYISNFLNWILCIFLFGWIWMAF